MSVEVNYVSPLIFPWERIVDVEGVGPDLVDGMHGEVLQHDGEVKLGAMIHITFQVYEDFPTCPAE